jgi:DNA polymerase III alpha subunit
VNSVVSFAGRPPTARPHDPAYAELMVTSNFSFLRSGSHPEELVSAAMHLGLSGIGIADRNSFAGVVRGYVVHRDTAEKFPGFRYVVGVRLAFADGTPDIIAYPSDRLAYGRLCQLLTTGNRRAPKGDCHLRFNDLEAFTDVFIAARILRDRNSFIRDDGTPLNYIITPSGCWAVFPDAASTTP